MYHAVFKCASERNKSYVDTENPDSSTNNFTTLSKQINNIVDYDIPNVKAYVIEGGIAKDASLLISILEYKNKIDDIAAQKEMAYYDANKTEFPYMKVHDIRCHDPDDR